MESFLPSYFFDLESFEHKSLFDHCENVWQILSQIEKYLSKQKLGNIEIDIPQGAYLVNPELISIGKGSVVEQGAYIKGPCIIGENCTIRHGAYIRGQLITGSGCVIGHDTEVKNSVFLNNAHAAHFAYVGDSILGNRVNLGAGTILANLRIDRQSITIPNQNGRINTGLRKFGAIIGDDSQTGCNSVLNPGTLLGKKVGCYPALNFGGFIPSGHTIRSDTKIVITKNHLD